MILRLDPASHVPPFEQIRAQIAEQARSGVLPVHHRLPPVRRLAADLGLAANTVARAYRELEQSGVVETRGRHGTYVRAPDTDTGDEAKQAAADYARRIAALGLSAERGLVLARAALGLHVRAWSGPDDLRGYRDAAETRRA
jgi:DNA-binding transcriptional regulator YhcF (GntR family)